MKTTWKKNACLGLICLLMALVLAGCGGPKVSMEDCTKVTFSGADGYGRVSTSFDGDQVLYLAYGDDAGIEKNFGSAMRAMDYFYDVKITADPSENLSNGDKVTFTVTYPEQLEEILGVSISPKSGGTWTVTVSDLPEVEEFDPFENLTVSFSGYDTRGTVELTGGNDKLRYTADRTDALSNGEKITVTIEGGSGGFDTVEEYCIETLYKVPTSISKEYEVSGLDEISVIDLFEGIEITSSGIAPEGKLEVTGKYDGIAYRYDANGLSNGDTVTINAVRSGLFAADTVEDYCLENFGGLPESTSMEYTVTDLAEYVSTAAGIPAKLLEDMQKEAQDQITAMVASDSGLKMTECKYIGCYILTAKPGASLIWKAHTSADLVYQLSITDSAGTHTCYIGVEYSNPLVYADGTGSVNLSYATLTSHWDAPVTIGWTGKGGFETLDQLYNFYVAANLADYTFDTDID